MSSNIQLKNENGELSTMQTSGGFSNTRRSPREPSFESNNHKRGQGDQQLKIRPQLISSQNYNSLHQLRPVDKESGSLRPIPGANSTSYEFNNINEEEEYAYQDDKKAGGFEGRDNVNSDHNRRGGGKRKLALMQINNQNSSESHLKSKVGQVASPGSI